MTTTETPTGAAAMTPADRVEALADDLQRAGVTIDTTRTTLLFAAWVLRYRLTVPVTAETARQFVVQSHDADATKDVRFWPVEK